MSCEYTKFEGEANTRICDIAIDLVGNASDIQDFVNFAADLGINLINIKSDRSAFIIRSSKREGFPEEPSVLPVVDLDQITSTIGKGSKMLANSVPELAQVMANREPAFVRVAVARSLRSVSTSERERRGRMIDAIANGSITEEEIIALIPNTDRSASICVVVHCDNDPNLLCDSLASIRVCDHQKLDVIIVDHCSNDKSAVKVLEAARRSGIMVVDDNAPIGQIGSSIADSRIISPFILEISNGALLDHEVLTRALHIMSTNQRVGVVYQTGPTSVVGQSMEEEFNRSLNILDCFPCPDLAIYRREAIEGVSWPVAGPVETWDLWLLLIESGWEIAKITNPNQISKVGLNSGFSGMSYSEYAAAIGELVKRHLPLYSKYLPEIVARLAVQTVAMSNDSSSQSLADSSSWREVRELTDQLAAVKAELDRQTALAFEARHRNAAADPSPGALKLIVENDSLRLELAQAASELSEQIQRAQVRVEEAELRTAEARRQIVEAEERLETVIALKGRSDSARSESERRLAAAEVRASIAEAANVEMKNSLFLMERSRAVRAIRLFRRIIR